MSSVMQLNQKTFRFMGYMRPHLITWIPSIIPNIIFAILTGMLIYGNAAYIYVYADDIKKAAGAFYILSAIIICFAANIDVASKKRNVERFFVDLTAIVEERK